MLRKGMPTQFADIPHTIFYHCVEDSNDAIMITNTAGLLVYVNAAWSKIYGYSSAEALGKTPRLLHSGYQADDFYKEMWSQIRDPKVGYWKGELVNRAKDGSLVPVLLSITPYRGDDGGFSGFMGIAVDISYRRELEAKVAHQDRLASVGLLASGLAHEIGTPLGVIRGRAEFLAMRAKEPKIRTEMEIVTAEIDRISKLIRSLLRVSRDFTDVQLAEVSPRAVIDEVLGLVGQNLREDLVEIRNAISSEVRVRADFDRLVQILLNLVINAIHAIRKATKDGRVDRHFLEFTSEVRRDGFIEIRVTDTGCGIPEENFKKLFQAFFTTKDVGEGTGLGLAIVSQLVHEMQGQILVRSKVGEGTTFSIALPNFSV
jgi:PAS domain S-box-containing protein